MASVLEVEAMMGKFDRAFNHIASLEARLRAAEEALKDFRDKGLRCDLTPTMRIVDASETYMAMARYLRRQDEGVRERARKALATASGEGEAGERLVTPPKPSDAREAVTPISEHERAEPPGVVLSASEIESVRVAVREGITFALACKTWPSTPEAKDDYERVVRNMYEARALLDRKGET